MKIRHTAAIYYTLQGIAVIAWWTLLFFVPASRRYFQLESNSETSLLAFWLADLSFLGMGSLVAALLCFRSSQHAPTASWFVTGAVSYATMYCLAFAFFTDTGWLGVSLMLPAMIWSGNFSIAISSVSNAMFRQAKASSTHWILLKTFAQIFIVWSLILVVFPYFITILEDKLGVSRISFPFQKIISALLFIGISLIGLTSAYTMSRVGRGTPLPLDTAPNLVISGSYSYVRNPMAVSGIGQGLAVALFLGSPLTAIYTLMGAFIWQFIFRPLEEEDLLKRFGADYENYCRAVRCWIPRINSYKSE
jgi:protein-S-isoprenylcysteine O-methyltransferase Ste14